MPPELGGIFLSLHDQLSKRTSRERPSDYVVGIKPKWARPPPFERQAGYDPNWLRYDKVDIYGDLRAPCPDPVCTGGILDHCQNASFAGC
jgi:hypothetical protein